jgi:hypothetical protein
MEDVIINKVQQSILTTINLEEFLPKAEIIGFDLKPFLYMELILKEKDYREALKQHDFTPYTNKIIAIHCGTDAIIPVWAYMLAATHIRAHALHAYMGTPEQVRTQLLLQQIEKINEADYNNKRLVIKGCGEIVIPNEAYTAITNKLLPVAQSIMYGEPCSTVPVYKRKINRAS